MRRSVLVYVTLVGLAVLAVAGVLQMAAHIVPAAPAFAPPRPGSDGGPVAQMLAQAQHPLARLMLQLVIIIAATRVCGALAARVGQPLVVGEIAAGIVLGPSLLGGLLPGVSAALFPRESLPTLDTLSQIGVLLFMFVVGVELDAAHLRRRARAAVAISHSSIAIPFILGMVSSLALHRDYAPAGVPFHAFALFLGIAMSITALPVLARMLEERGLSRTPLGTTAITSAAIGDLTAWTLLAFVVAITTSAGAAATLVTMVALSATFVVVMIFLVRPVLGRHLANASRTGTLGREEAALVLAALLSSALVAELIGIHALFGAFLAGTIMPAEVAFRRALRERLETVSAVLLLPLFFAYTGLRTEIGLLDDGRSWVVCGVIVLVATLGKIAGTMVAARWTGHGWSESFTLGALMNTRGLMELVALTVGYDLGILSPEIFTMLVLMALATTAMTGPLVTLADNWHKARTPAEAPSR